MPPAISPEGGLVEIAVSALGGISESLAYKYGSPDPEPSDEPEQPEQPALPTPDQTIKEIVHFFEARADILLSHMPAAQRRFLRLQGRADAVASPGSLLMSYLPIIANGGSLAGSASLAQIEAMAGNEQSPRFDAWFEGTFGVLSRGRARGEFAIIAFGADYLVNDDLLVGGFFQIDQLWQESGAGHSRGYGWVAGPYLTARLAEHLYLDLSLAAGRADNLISPVGTYEDW